MKKVLTIAGSDCSGGAGVQADLKTMTAHKVYGMSVFTMLTAQNTTGIQEACDVPDDFVEKQIDSCFTDIFPDAVKTGALFKAEKIERIAKKLEFYRAKNVVVDPVMVCTAKGGITDSLLEENAIDDMVNKLFAVADIITPNIPEAEVLYRKISGENIKIDSREKMVQVAKILAKYVRGGYVLLKGGHFNDCSDCLYNGDNIIWFDGKRVDTKNTHGTGCTLSSAIACNLSNGLDIAESVRRAKDYVYNAILKNEQIGKGFGPVNHCWCL